jgi:hypothetical protein
LSRRKNSRKRRRKDLLLSGTATSPSTPLQDFAGHSPSDPPFTENYAATEEQIRERPTDAAMQRKQVNQQDEHARIARNVSTVAHGHATSTVRNPQIENQGCCYLLVKLKSVALPTGSHIVVAT